MNKRSHVKETLKHLNKTLLASILLVSSLSLSSCTSATESNSDEAKDITNAVLTETSHDCGDFAATYESNVKDVKNDTDFAGQLIITAGPDSCQVTANSIPNYDFNDSTAHFATDVAEITTSFNITRSPKIASSSTDLSLLTYGAVMLNGVVLDQVANGCYMPDAADADHDGNVANGCGLWVDWRLDALGKISLGADSHNAHTQPDGLYHYHGNPYALYDTEDKTKASPVIGFAADGFPIYGPRYIDETTGQVVEATSGYTIKSGNRPTGDNSPGGSYDGTYVQDYEFTDAGSLDKCNGKTVNGEYGYYVTESYPYIMGCYSGTPDSSFFKFWDIAKWIIAALVGLVALFTALTIRMIRRRRRKRQDPKLIERRESTN